MLILILIDVQYSQSADFSFKKVLNCQNHSSLGSHHHTTKFRKKIPHPAKFTTPPTPYCYLQNPAYFKKDSHSARRKHDLAVNRAKTTTFSEKSPRSLGTKI